MIQLENVVKNYTSTVKIGEIILDIPSEGITALVGPNGAGKSTTLTMIGRLMGADEGVITVAGLDVSKTRSNDLAKILSILRQENHFVTRLTVKQLISFGRFPYSKGRINLEDEQIINEAIEFFALTDLQDRYLDQLSGGQRQRAYVAMVMAQSTDYILLDEPLNNLDIYHSVQMMGYLKQAAKDLGKTILIVMHDINMAAQYADRICAMKDGKIIAFDLVENIMNDDLLSQIFNTEIHVIDGPKGKIAVY